jgi:hypothetical protein
VFEFTYPPYGISPFHRLRSLRNSDCFIFRDQLHDHGDKHGRKYDDRHQHRGNFGAGSDLFGKSLQFYGGNIGWNHYSDQYGSGRHELFDQSSTSFGPEFIRKLCTEWNTHGGFGYWKLFGDCNQLFRNDECEYLDHSDGHSSADLFGRSIYLYKWNRNHRANSV